MAGEICGSEYVVQISTDSGSTYTTIAGCTAHDLTQTNEVVDITNKDSRSQALIASCGKITVSGNISGFISSNAAFVSLRTASVGASAGGLVYLKFLEDTGGNDFEGTFVVQSWQQNSPDKEGATFSCAFTSSGDIAYTVA